MYPQPIVFSFVCRLHIFNGHLVLTMFLWSPKLHLSLVANDTGPRVVFVDIFTVHIKIAAPSAKLIDSSSAHECTVSPCFDKQTCL